MERRFPAVTFVNHGQEAGQYQAILQEYFSNQTKLHANCFIQPTSTSQISQIVTSLSQNQCKFAVKGGGHSLVVGANGITDGVTIDLRSMNKTTLSDDKKTASIGPGAKWGDVYRTLNPLGYGVPGGRASTVGVSGLTTGGGNSFYAARFGFVCDNVRNFEVVLGNGTVVDANGQENPDLFKGLKGGFGNLGIVSRFDIVAFKAGPLWGGVAFYYGFEAIFATIKPFVDFTNQIDNDPFGSLIQLWYHTPVDNKITQLNLYEYTGNATEKQYYTHLDPEDSTKPFPAPFENFTFSGPVGKPAANTLRVADQGNLTDELVLPLTFYNIFGPACFTANVTVFTEVTRILQRILQPYIDNPNSAPYTEAQGQFQPLPRVFSDHSLERGGNVMGLDRYPDNNILFLTVLVWTDPAKSDEIHALNDYMLGNITQYTKSVGAFKPWQYINYAYESQDPIGSYGTNNVRFLKKVSREYDPAQVFQNLVPGGFKLGDAGNRMEQFNFNHFNF